MQKYYIRIGGGIAVRQIEFEDKFLSDRMAVEYLERSLQYYYPVYYEATLSKVTYSDSCTFSKVANFRAKVAVSVEFETNEDASV